MFPHQHVVMLRGDGSAMMSLGRLSLFASERPANLIHIILDNDAYESTDRQPSISFRSDLSQISANAGYPRIYHVRDVEELESALAEAHSTDEFSLILVKVGIDPVASIPEVSHTPSEIPDRFKAAVRSQT